MYRSAGRRSDNQMPCCFRENPIRVLPSRTPLLHLSSSQKHSIWQFAELPPKGTATVSDCLHYLKVHSLRSGKDDKVAAKSESQFLYSVLQNGASSRAFLGMPAFVAVRNGVRMTTARRSRADESHQNQGLATLAELGMPLSWPLDLDGHKHSLREAIEDCVANFYLKEKELAWTAIALAYYLPPTRGWSNRFGESFTFDDLAHELLIRSFSSQCCGGAHLVQAATVLLRVDLEQPVLSDATRLQLQHYVGRCVDAAIRAQRPEGYWTPDWYKEMGEEVSPYSWSPKATTEACFLITSHLAEWMLYLPVNMRAPDDTQRNAAEWMLARLHEMPAEPTSPLCPRTHVVFVLECVSVPNADTGMSGRAGVQRGFACDLSESSFCSRSQFFERKGVPCGD